MPTHAFTDDEPFLAFWFLTFLAVTGVITQLTDQAQTDGEDDITETPNALHVRC